MRRNYASLQNQCEKVKIDVLDQINDLVAHKVRTSFLFMSVGCAIFVQLVFIALLIVWKLVVVKI